MCQKRRPKRCGNTRNRRGLRRRKRHKPIQSWDNGTKSRRRRHASRACQLFINLAAPNCCPCTHPRLCSELRRKRLTRGLIGLTHCFHEIILDNFAPAVWRCLALLSLTAVLRLYLTDFFKYAFPEEFTKNRACCGGAISKNAAVYRYPINQRTVPWRSGLCLRCLYLRA
jgi:hypothetical protein